MILDYETYENLTLDPVTEDVFKVLEPDAETYISEWTHGRDTTGYTSSVQMVMAKVVDGLWSLRGERVTSYDNGVDKWEFDVDDRATIEAQLYDMAMRILPVELVGL